jgi:superfamily II DNA or RNA helicase
MYVYLGTKINSTKIGHTSDLLNRLSTYKTSYPFNNINIYCLIESQIAPIIEDLLLDEYDKYSSTHDPHYIDGGIEWITYKPSIAEIENTLKKWRITNFRIICGDELDKILQELKRKQSAADDKTRLDRMRRVNKFKSLFAYLPKLHGYQVEAFDKIMKMKDKRCNINVFCGGGKTVIYHHIFEARRRTVDCFVLVVPSISLMSDMKNRWGYVREYSWRMLCVSSAEFATTDGDKINAETKHDKLFVLITVQSFKKIEILLKSKYKNIEIIFDEAHNLCDVQCTRSNSPLQWLSNNKFDKLISKMYFATATPKIGTHKDINKIVMNNPEYFGQPIILSKPANLRRLYNENFLCPYQIIMGTVNKGELTSISEDWKSSNAKNKEHFLNYQVSCRIIKKMIKSNRCKKILMYTNGIGGDNRNTLGVRDLYKYLEGELLESTLNIGLFFADSLVANKINIKTQRKFEDKLGEYDITILVNCRMYSEGINIPGIDTVVFCDPKQSVTEIIQIVGRVLRNPQFPNKSTKMANIVIPYVSNMSARYEKVLNIIKTISTQDPFLKEELRSRKRTNCKSAIIKHVSNDFKLMQFEVDIKIFTYLKESICIEKSTWEESVLHVLGDLCEWTSREIYDFVVTNKIHRKISEIEHDKILGELLTRGEIEKVASVNKYFLRVFKKISICEFVKELQNKNIYDEHDYRNIARYNEIFPINPVDYYKGFSWNMLIKKCYSLNECIDAINKMQESALKNINGYKTDIEKNKILTGMDSMIPDIRQTYKITDLSKINKAIFSRFDDFD